MESDIEKAIRALTDMRPRYSWVPAVVKVLHQYQDRPQEFVLAPDEDGYWWIGPQGAERRWTPHLNGIPAIWLSIRYTGDDTIRAHDFVGPGCRYPDNACRNAIACAAVWISTLDGCELLAAVIREGISVAGGVVRFDEGALDAHRARIITII